MERPLRDTENVPLSEDVATYFKREVLPHAPDAWIDAELKQTTDRILDMIKGLSA